MSAATPRPWSHSVPAHPSETRAWVYGSFADGNKWRLAECDALDPDHEARASVNTANAALIVKAVNSLEATERLVEELEKALRKADQFITNGVELGFIRMPDASAPDPAHDTPSLVRTALASIADWRKP